MSGIARFFKKIYLRLFRINDTPNKVALGFGLGVFLGVFPGSGPVAAFFLAIALRVNKAAALLGSILTNTWLSIPVFFAAVKTGSVVTGISPYDIRNGWSALMSDFSWAKLAGVSFYKIITPIAIGYAVVSFCMALAAYGIILAVLKYSKPVTRR